MQAAFELKPYHRVLLRNGHTAIAIPNPGEDASTPLVFILNPEGWMPALMSYSAAAPAWDVVKVFDKPHLIRDVLDFNRQGNMLWEEEAKEVRVARADVRRAEADLEAAQKRLAEALTA